jgi:hypothetical protein
MKIVLSIACVLGVSLARPQSEEIRPPFSSYLSCGKLFYRTLLLDESRNSLYVGAMDRVVRVNLQNVSETNCDSDSLLLEPSNVGSCVSKGKSENYDCRNHIRVIQPIGDGEKLYVCGTNAHNPADLVVFANLTNPGTQHMPGVGSGIGKCPFDPEDNSTAIWVENGNPGGLAALYSGTNAEFTKADSVIFRTDLHNPNSGRREYSFKRTIKYDSHMLDKPDFVGSYEIGDYVYFFLREIAVEYMNCGKGIFSRIARVCKRDTGGKNILLQNWATYLKAKLNCSIPGEFPFYFNEIQSVYKIPDDDTKFYAVFTTGLNGLHGSAVCTFDLNAVHAAFDGKFKEQATSTSAWLPVPLSKVPEPRPGSCVEDTRELPDRVLNFMRSHPLMDEEVDHQGGEPVFYKRNVVFTHLVVDKISTGVFSEQREYTVFYIGGTTGQIYKVAQWNQDGKLKSQLLDIFQGTVEGEPIRALELSRRLRMLYITSDNGIRQINLNMCSARYSSCLQCSLDPMCGWDREKGVCSAYTSSLLSDPTRSKDGICDSSIFKRKLIANFGQSLHLSCSVGKSEITSEAGVEWHHYSKTKGRYRVDYRVEKHVLTNDNGLVVINVSDQDSGRYDCLYQGQLVSSYHIAVDTHRCSAPNKTADYQKIYSDWCNQFEKYKLALKTWEKRQGKCTPNGQDVSSNQIFDSSRFF